MICPGCHNSRNQHFKDCPKNPDNGRRRTTPAAPLAANPKEGHTMTRIIINAPHARIAEYVAQAAADIDAGKTSGHVDRETHWESGSKDDTTTILPARVKLNGSTVAAFDSWQVAAKFAAQMPNIYNPSHGSLTAEMVTITFEMAAV